MKKSAKKSFKGFTQHHFPVIIFNLGAMFKLKNNKKHPLRRFGESGAGFTIIELLIVVTIIAVLTGIVLTNITQYLNRGKDSSIQADLSSLATNAAVWFDNAAVYTGFCASTTATNPITAAKTAYGNSVGDTADCNEGAIVFAACSQLKVTDSYFCIDSTGVKKTIAGRATCVAAWNAMVCP